MKRFLLWGPAVAQMLLIFLASSIPGDQVPGTISDKLAHLLVYAVLGACFVLPLSGGRAAGVTPGRAAAAVLLAVLYGVSDEVHQSFTPGRTPDAMDVLADAAGAAIGAAAVLVAAFAVVRFRTARPE